MIFGRKKENESKTKYAVPFDPKLQIPVLKCSICNGEQVAGFKDKKSGHFTEIAFIRNSQDLEEFLRTYGIENITKEY